MSNYAFTVFNGKEEIVSVNDIHIAREAIKELGGNSYIQYNKAGIKSREICKEYQDHVNQIDNEVESLSDKMQSKSILADESEDHSEISELLQDYDNLDAQIIALLAQRETYQQGITDLGLC